MFFCQGRKNDKTIESMGNSRFSLGQGLGPVYFSQEIIVTHVPVCKNPDGETGESKLIYLYSIVKLYKT